MELKGIESSFQKCVSWNFIRNTLIVGGERPTVSQAVTFSEESLLINAFVLKLV